MINKYTDYRENMIKAIKNYEERATKAVAAVYSKFKDNVMNIDEKPLLITQLVQALTVLEQGKIHIEDEEIDDLVKFYGHRNEVGLDYLVLRCEEQTGKPVAITLEDITNRKDENDARTRRASLLRRINVNEDCGY